MNPREDDIRKKHPRWENRRQVLAGVPLIPGASYTHAYGETKRWTAAETAGLDAYIRILRRMMALTSTIEYQYDEARIDPRFKNIALGIFGLLYKDFGRGIKEDQDFKGLIFAAWEASYLKKAKVPMTFENLWALLDTCIEGEYNYISFNKLTIHSTGRGSAEEEVVKEIYWDIRDNSNLQNRVEETLALTRPQNTILLFNAPHHFVVSMAPLVDRFPVFQEIARLSFLAVGVEGHKVQKQARYRYKLLAVVRLGDDKYEDQCRVYDESVREVLPVCFDGIPIPPPKPWSITSTPGRYILWYRKLGDDPLDLMEDSTVIEKLEDRHDYFMIASPFMHRIATESADNILQQLIDEEEAIANQQIMDEDESITAEASLPKAPKSPPKGPRSMVLRDQQSIPRHDQRQSERGSGENDGIYCGRKELSQLRQGGAKGYGRHRGRGNRSTKRSRHREENLVGQSVGIPRSGDGATRGYSGQGRRYFGRGGIGRSAQTIGRDHFREESRREDSSYGGGSFHEEIGGRGRDARSDHHEPIRQPHSLLPQLEVFARSDFQSHERPRSSVGRHSDRYRGRGDGQQCHSNYANQKRHY